MQAPCFVGGKVIQGAIVTSASLPCLMYLSFSSANSAQDRYLPASSSLLLRLSVSPQTPLTISVPAMERNESLYSSWQAPGRLRRRPMPHGHRHASSHSGSGLSSPSVSESSSSGAATDEEREQSPSGSVPPAVVDAESDSSPSGSVFDGPPASRRGLSILLAITIAVLGAAYAMYSAWPGPSPSPPPEEPPQGRPQIPILPVHRALRELAAALVDPVHLEEVYDVDFRYELSALSTIMEPCAAPVAWDWRDRQYVQMEAGQLRDDPLWMDPKDSPAYKDETARLRRAIPALEGPDDWDERASSCLAMEEAAHRVTPKHVSTTVALSTWLRKYGTGSPYDGDRLLLAAARDVARMLDLLVMDLGKLAQSQDGQSTNQGTWEALRLYLNRLDGTRCFWGPKPSADLDDRFIDLYGRTYRESMLGRPEDQEEQTQDQRKKPPRKPYKPKNPQSDSAKRDKEKPFSFRHSYLAKSAELVRHLDSRAQDIRFVMSEAEIRMEDLRQLCGVDESGQRRTGENVPPPCIIEDLPDGWVGEIVTGVLGTARDYGHSMPWRDAMRRLGHEAERLEKRAGQIQSALQKIDTYRRIIRAALHLHDGGLPGWAERSHRRLSPDQASHFSGYGAIYQTDPRVFCKEEPAGLYLSSVPSCPPPSCAEPSRDEPECRIAAATADRLSQEISTLEQAVAGDTSIDEPRFRREVFRGDLGTWQRFLRYWRERDPPVRVNQVFDLWRQYEDVEYHLRLDATPNAGDGSTDPRLHRYTSRAPRRDEVETESRPGRHSCDVQGWLKSQLSTAGNDSAKHAKHATDRSRETSWRDAMSLLSRVLSPPQQQPPPFRLPRASTQLLELLEALLDLNERHKPTTERKSPRDILSANFPYLAQGDLAKWNALALAQRRGWPIWFLEEAVHNASDVFDTGDDPPGRGLQEPTEREQKIARERLRESLKTCREDGKRRGLGGS